MKKIGWFSSGRDKEAITLLKNAYHYLKKRDILISWVFTNLYDGLEQYDTPIKTDKQERHYWESEFISTVRNLGIPLVSIPSRNFLPSMRNFGLNYWRAYYGETILRTINFSEVELVVLAGYMLILGEPELEAAKFINLHPALPDGPAGTWQDVINSIIDSNSGRHGLMVHEVTNVLDKGPVVLYDEFPVKGSDWDHLWKPNMRKELFNKIREVGAARESDLLNRAIVKSLEDK